MTATTTAATEAREGEVRRRGGFAYYVFVTGATLIAISVVDESMNITIVATLGAWALATMVLLPGRTRAGQGLFLAITIALLERNYSGLVPEARFFAVANMAVLMSVFMLQPLKKTAGFPFLHIWCVVELVYVYMSSLISVPPLSFVYTFTDDVRVLGYRTLFVFTLLVVAVGVIATRAFGLRRPTLLDIPTLPAASVYRGYLLTIVGFGGLLFASVTKLDSSLGSMLEAIRDIGYGGVLLLVIVWMQGNLRVGHKIVVVAIAAGIALDGLGAGALYRTAIPGFLLLALYISFKRKVPWTMMFVALAILTILNVQKGAFRQETWGGRSSGSTTELGVSWLQLTADEFDNTDQSDVSSSAHRFANSDLLGYVVKWAPDRYDYMGYNAYTSLPTVLIPRVIMPDKGSFNDANEFGRRYELIARSDYGTTVNTPLHTEAYLAGGIFVLVLVGAFSGFYLALLGLVLRSGKAAAILTGCVLTYQVILTIESGILGFALTLPFALVLYPIMWWATRSETLTDIRRARVERKRPAAVSDPAPTPPTG